MTADHLLRAEAASIADCRPDVIDIHARLTDREHTPTASPPHGFRDARRRHRALAALARITNGAR